MCTVRDIEEAIREHCQSQHDMESTEIDQVMQRLPFGTAQDVFTRPPVPSWKAPGTSSATSCGTGRAASATPSMLSTSTPSPKRRIRPSRIRLHQIRKTRIWLARIRKSRQN